MSRHIIVDLETVAIDDAGTYVEPVSAPSNYKDTEKIAVYEAEKRAEQIGKCALDPDLCRIVALGVMVPGFEPSVMVCRNEIEEFAALSSLWERFTAQSVLVGFNILNFDALVLLRRSLYLDVRAPQLRVDRFRHPQIEDLMLRLSFNGALKYHGLSFYTNRFKLPPVEDDVTGAEIPQLVKDGAWDRVASHCRADLWRTLHLARRLGLVPQAQPQAVEAV